MLADGLECGGSRNSLGTRDIAALHRPFVAITGYGLGGNEADALSGGHLLERSLEVCAEFGSGGDFDGAFHGDLVCLGGAFRGEVHLVITHFGEDGREFRAAVVFDTGIGGIPRELFNSIGEDGAERSGLSGYDLGRTGDTGVVDRDRALHFRVPSLVAVDFLVALAVGVRDGCVVRAHAIMEIGLAVDHHHVTLVISHETLGQHAAAELGVHGLLDLVARTALVPNADFIVNGVLSIGFARPEVERSESTDSTKCRTAVDRTGTLAVNIDIEAALVDHHGDVVPATYLQSTVGVHALFAHCVPTCGEFAVGISVEHELSPATGL